jgi:hypothetical protein
MLKIAVQMFKREVLKGSPKLLDRHAGRGKNRMLFNSHISRFKI